jgi:hypothetical protein
VRLINASYGNIDSLADIWPIRALLDQVCDLEADVVPIVARRCPTCRGRSKTGAPRGSSGNSLPPATSGLGFRLPFSGFEHTHFVLGGEAPSCLYAETTATSQDWSTIMPNAMPPRDPDDDDNDAEDEDAEQDEDEEPAVVREPDE